VESDQPVAHRVVVYSKPGCHLCEDALALLNDLRAEFQIAIAEIDITTDDALHKKYFDQIPILVIDNRVTLAAPIRAQDVHAALIS
jgi:glutaredoxin